MFLLFGFNYNKGTLKYYGWWTKSCMTLRTLKHGNYGIFLIMGNAGFCPSTVLLRNLSLMQIESRKAAKPSKQTAELNLSYHHRDSLSTLLRDLYGFLQKGLGFKVLRDHDRDPQ